ncbi:MAG: hypothetical protein HKM05_05110, partial [Spirochaetales bacterium]|nr:hypothetical protein [Spirochaetales bacterium]
PTPVPTPATPTPLPLPTSPPALSPWQLLLLLAVLSLMLYLATVARTLLMLFSVLLSLLPLAAVVFLLWPLVEILQGKAREEPWLIFWRRRLSYQLLRFWRALLRQKASTKFRRLGEKQKEEAQTLARRWSQHGQNRRYSQLAEEFLRIVHWAQAQEQLGPAYAYLPWETTRAYLKRLATAVPDLATPLNLVAQAIDQELFAPQPLTSQEWRNFLLQVRTVVDFPQKVG